MNKEKLKVI
jgi:hypothetical protein